MTPDTKTKCRKCGKVFPMYGYMVKHYQEQHINPRFWCIK